MKIKPIRKFMRMLTPPPDKSITQRAVITALVSDGKCEIINPSFCGDCKSTINAAVKLGADVEVRGGRLYIERPRNLTDTEIDCGNSGTAMRLLTGLLSGVHGTYKLIGDASLSRRPMDRVIAPLAMMGAHAVSTQGHAPICIKPSDLRGVDYTLPVASAQVKSALLMAGISADGTTIVRERIPTRDHTERILRRMGANIEITSDAISVRSSRLNGVSTLVPGDMSSAAYSMCLAAAIPDAYLCVRGVGLNPTRMGLLRVFDRMGVDYSVDQTSDDGEPMGNVVIHGGDIGAFEVNADEIPSLIDEVPLLAVLACFADGESVIRGVAELRKKESDRLAATVDNLRAMGAKIEASKDDIIIKHSPLDGGVIVDPRGDHRIAMSMAVAGALSRRGVRIDDEACVDVSYPDFWEVLI